MKFSTKLLIGFGLILLLFTLVAIIKISLSGKVTTHINSVSHSGDILRQSALLQKMALNLETGFRGYILTNNKEALEPYEQTLPMLEVAFQKQRQLVENNPQELDKINKIERILNRWVDSFASPIIQNKNTASPKAGTAYQSLFERKIVGLEGKKTMDTIREQFAEFDSMQNQKRDKHRSMLQTSLANTDKYTLFLTIFSILAASIIAWLILKTFRKKINEMMLQAENISRGKFNVISPEQGKDELSILSNSLNAMNHKLNESFSELERSNKELEQFAYVASHDLREPLRTISSFSKLLTKKLNHNSDEDTRQYLQLINDGAIRMERLINDLLEYSRVGTHGKAFEETDLNKAVNIALANLTAAIEESGAKIFTDKLPVVQADNSQIIQLFQNLIANAIKFRKEGTTPEIHISATEDENNYTITVKDNGIGISQEHWDRIFMIFQRLHTKEEYQGTGIGLAVCKKIAERHGGTIRVTSAPEEGTSFHVSFKKVQGEK